MKIRITIITLLLLACLSSLPLGWAQMDNQDDAVKVYIDAIRVVALEQFPPAHDLILRGLPLVPDAAEYVQPEIVGLDISHR